MDSKTEVHPAVNAQTRDKTTWQILGGSLPESLATVTKICGNHSSVEKRDSVSLTENLFLAFNWLRLIPWRNLYRPY